MSSLEVEDGEVVGRKEDGASSLAMESMGYNLMMGLGNRNEDVLLERAAKKTEQ